MEETYNTQFFSKAVSLPWNAKLMRFSSVCSYLTDSYRHAFVYLSPVLFRLTDP